MTKTLDMLSSGETAKIVSYSEDGDVSLRRHLLGMGFVKGTELKIQKVAPLGDPIELKIKGYNLCIRKEEAKNIEVE